MRKAGVLGNLAQDALSDFNKKNKTCVNCGGRGEIEKVRGMPTLCPECEGNGRLDNETKRGF